MTACLEMVRFRLAEGVDRAAFLASVPEVSNWAARQPGFLHRSLAETAEGGWIDLVWWEGRAAAEAAAAKVMGALGASAFMAAIDTGTVEMAHHDVAHLSSMTDHVPAG